MKVVIVGAYGKLGSDIVKKAVGKGFDVTAVGRTIRPIEGIDEKEYHQKQVDVTNQKTIEGLFHGADVVITTVGLTKASTCVNCYDIDYQGNKNLIDEAVKEKVKKFVYISVVKAEQGDGVPMVHAKYLLEEELKKSGLSYVIHRPSGFFYDIAHVFMPMVEKGKVSLLGKKPVYANVIDTSDFAEFILEHLQDENKTYQVGGRETYSYEEMAKLFFDAANKPTKISYAPAWLFDVLGTVNRWKKNGKEPIIRFSKWTLSNDMVAETKFGDKSFKDYVKECYK